MKIADIYALKPIAITHELDMFISAAKDILNDSIGDAAPTLNSVVKIWEYAHEHEHLIDTNRWAIHIYMNESTDYGKYGARLFAVYFDEWPIMLVKNSGRYFGDFNAYLTDKNQLNQFAEYLLSLATQFVVTDELEVFSADEDIENIENVADYRLSDYYSVTVNPQYNVDDVVWAWVPENHLVSHWQKEYKGSVLTKVKITKVQPLNPIQTYFGSQIERCWQEVGVNQMKLDSSTTSPIGCAFCGAFVVGKVDEIPMPDMAINNHVDENGIIHSDYTFSTDQVLNYMKAFN